VIEADQYVDLSISRCEDIEDALKNGREVPAPIKGWNETELLRLAGVCLSQLTFSDVPVNQSALVQAYSSAFTARHLKKEDDNPR
jgi:hypothetical protein